MFLKNTLSLTSSASLQTRLWRPMSGKELWRLFLGWLRSEEMSPPPLSSLERPGLARSGRGNAWLPPHMHPRVRRRWMKVQSSVPLLENRRVMGTLPSLQLDATVIFQCHWNLLPSHDEADVSAKHWLPQAADSYQADRHLCSQIRNRASGQTCTRHWPFTLTDAHIFLSMLPESTGPV